MRITKLYIKEYKNLKDFTWELSPESPVVVIVGKNASGKTNLVEAIAKIFQQVLLHKQKSDVNDDVQNTDTDFEFELAYSGYDGEDLIEIHKKDRQLIVKKNSREIHLAEIASPFQPQPNNEKILPENIFLYYAGISDRFAKSLKELESRFCLGITDGKITNGRSVMNYEPVHYKAAMLALLLSPLPDIREFLAYNFNITGLHELRIVIGKPRKESKGSADDYWDAPANIKNWIDRLRKYAYQNGIKETFRQEKQWSLLFHAEQFSQDAVREFDYEFGLFRILDSLSVTHYLKQIEIYFKKQGVMQPIEFDQLGEGEKQRLAICGAIEIFRGKETLFLLDEPDAFSHPHWQWDFIPDLSKTDGEKTFSQVIFVTQSALVLSTAKGNAFLMDNGKIESISEVYGMDVNSVLINVMDSDKRIPQVETDFGKYFSLIEKSKGETEQTKDLRNELEKIYPLNHPCFSKADMLISLYQ